MIESPRKRYAAGAKIIMQKYGKLSAFSRKITLIYYLSIRKTVLVFYLQEIFIQLFTPENNCFTFVKITQL